MCLSLSQSGADLTPKIRTADRNKVMKRKQQHENSLEIHGETFFQYLPHTSSDCVSNEATNDQSRILKGHGMIICCMEVQSNESIKIILFGC